MKKFLDEDFLLDTPTAVKLYHEYAEEMPIFDFHCHLSSKEIYMDKQFATITEAWLGGDHYKWRLMREMGIDESYITGDKSDIDKFVKFAEVLPYAIGNPMYHWCHLELKRFFCIDDILAPSSARQIFEKANAELRHLTARQLITRSNVTKLYTTDDPIDTLEWHIKLAEDKTFATQVLPAFRPDKAINIELPSYASYIGRLAAASTIDIVDLDSLQQALESRVDYFHSVGCVCSDHALDVVMYQEATVSQVDTIVKKALANQPLNRCEIEQYKAHILVFLGKLYHKRNWVQQYHIGALRNNSTRYVNLLGADTGFDATEDQPFASKLSKLLDRLDSGDSLPKTILYCLNPRDNEVLATIINCFQASGTVGKMQFGSGWWFNDQKDGMERQLEVLSQVALLSKFVGMLTDSRSLLSYTRHEYFRRILCNKLGDLIEQGQYPNDIALVGRIVQDICYNNAIKYFS